MDIGSLVLMTSMTRDSVETLSQASISLALCPCLDFEVVTQGWTVSLRLGDARGKRFVLIKL